MVLFFFSGMSSTVISSTVLFFLTWYTAWQTRKQKRNESLQSSSSFIAPARARSKIARAIRSSAVDIWRTRVLSALKRNPFELPLKARVEKNNRWFPMKANRSVRAQKLNVRWAIVDINSSSRAGEQIDACSKTERCFSRRLSCTALVPCPPQALKLLVPGGARPDHWHGPTCFSFITLTRRSSFGTGNYGLA